MSRLDACIDARDGRALAATVFRPPGPPRLSVVVGGAMGVPRGYYADFAAALSARGALVVTLDFRGTGGSREGRIQDEPATMTDWGALDLPAAIDWARAESGVRPAFVGHSAGGQVLGLADNAAVVERALFVAAQSGDWRMWSGLSRLGMAGIWYALLPALVGVLGRVPAGLGGGKMDLPPRVASEWARWGRTPGYLFGGAGGQARRASYARVRARILAYSFAGDDYAPRRAVAALLDGYPSAQREHRHLEGGAPLGHFGFFRRRSSTTLWEEAAAFLGA
jgi:predicted alpha/beta hydrolase